MSLLDNVGTRIVGLERDKDRPYARATSERSALRPLVFAIAAADILFWGIAVFRGHWLPRPLDPAGMHGVLLFVVAPALALGLWGRWLGAALVLVSLAAFMYLSVVLGGMISN